MRPVLFVVVLIASVAQDAAGGVPLGMALAKAYLENPRIEAARARLRAVDEEVPLALSAYRPTITASSAFAFDRVDQQGGVTELQTFRNALGIEQPIYTGGRAGAGLARAEGRVQAERARLDQVEQEVLLAAVAAYTAVLRDQRLLELALANEARILEQLEGTRQRFRFGELTMTDVAQAEARYAGAQAERARTLGELRRSGAAYRTVIGDPPGTLEPAGLPAALPASLDEAAELIDAHPAVRAAVLDLEIAASDIDIADAALKPRLTLGGEVSRVEEPSTDIAWQQDLKIGATLSVPLYQGGAAYARMRQSRQERSVRRHDLRAVRRSVAEEQVAAFELRQSLLQRLVALEERQRAAELAVDGVRKEALIGARSVIDVLDAEQELLGAQSALVEARREDVLAGYGLLASVGGLTAAGIALDAIAYDPQSYYREVRDKWIGTGADEDRATAGTLDAANPEPVAR